MKANVLLKKILMEMSANRKFKFAQETLENGTILEAEAFEAGNEVFIVTDEERIPLPVGEYVLADGRELYVEQEGMIASVGGAEQVAAEEMPEEDVKVEAQEEEVVVEAPAEVAAEVEAVVEAVVEVVAPLIEEVKAEMEEIKKEMGKYKEKMSKAPAARTIKHNPSKPTKDMFKISENRPQTTLDRVFSRLK